MLKKQSNTERRKERKAQYSAKIKYKYGSGRATGSTEVGTSQLKGRSESAVMEFLRAKHKTVKNLEIIIEKIDWK